MLPPELEAEIRGKIDPAYQDIKGTKSYERKILLDEIDRLRNFINREPLEIEQFRERLDKFDEWVRNL